MVSFDQSLTDLVRTNMITYEEALAHATNPDDFALFFRGVSKGGSTVEEPGTDSGTADAELEVDDGSIIDPAFEIDRFKR
jgi:Tfp pilus assembly ATPase PilU